MNPVINRCYTPSPEFGAARHKSPDTPSGVDSAPKSVKVDAGAIPKPKFIRGSLKEGVTRALKMAFLRPRGWLECASHIIFPIGAFVFPLKHFTEGLLGCDSLIAPRFIRLTNLSGAVQSGEKHGSIVGRIKECFLGGNKAEAAKV